MRPLALGRKNDLFAGSLEGGRRAATIYTLVGTAELNGWDPQTYLRALLLSHGAAQDATIRPDPSSAYGVAKFAGERMSLLAAQEVGVNLTVVRLSSAFGRWERATAVRPVASPMLRLTESAGPAGPALSLHKP